MCAFFSYQYSKYALSKSDIEVGGYEILQSKHWTDIVTSKKKKATTKTNKQTNNNINNNPPPPKKRPK